MQFANQSLLICLYRMFYCVGQLFVECVFISLGVVVVLLLNGTVLYLCRPIVVLFHNVCLCVLFVIPLFRCSLHMSVLCFIVCDVFISFGMLLCVNACVVLCM